MNESVLSDSEIRTGLRLDEAATPAPWLAVPEGMPIDPVIPLGVGANGPVEEVSRGVVRYSADQKDKDDATLVTWMRNRFRPLLLELQSARLKSQRKGMEPDMEDQESDRAPKDTNARRFRSGHLEEIFNAEFCWLEGEIQAADILNHDISALEEYIRLRKLPNGPVVPLGDGETISIDNDPSSRRSRVMYRKRGSEGTSVVKPLLETSLSVRLRCEMALGNLIREAAKAKHIEEDAKWEAQKE